MRDAAGEADSQVTWFAQAPLGLTAERVSATLGGMLTIAGGVLLGLLGFSVLATWASRPRRVELTREQMEEYERSTRHIK